VSTPRERIESASLPLLTRLSTLPRAIPFLALLALMVAGILLPGWGWVLLLLVVLFLGWIAYLTWPGLDTTNRIMRGTIILFAAAITLIRAFPHH
jgi:hypothetical protein